MICPLCCLKEIEHFDQDKQRVYFKCKGCDLVFVPRDSLISPMAEKTRYEAHENVENKNYVTYLEKIVQAMVPFLNVHDAGLDFGCGKIPLLGNLLTNQQFRMNSYDLFFLPDKSVLEAKYDFIILSEVIEHLRSPILDLAKLKLCLKEEGKVFIKTKLRPAQASEFSQWFYKRDSTHVQFFNKNSFKEVAGLLELHSCQEIGEDLFLFS